MGMGMDRTGLRAYVEPKCNEAKANYKLQAAAAQQSQQRQQVNCNQLNPTCPTENDIEVGACPLIWSMEKEADNEQGKL